MPFVSFCHLTAEARAPSTMVNSSADSGQPYCVPDLSRKALNFSPLRMMFAVGFS